MICKSAVETFPDFTMVPGFLHNLLLKVHFCFRLAHFPAESLRNLHWKSGFRVIPEDDW